MVYSSKSFTGMQTIIDAIPNAIFVKDRSHQIVLLNSSACEFFGRARETLLNNSDNDLFPAEQVLEFHAADDRAFHTGKETENEEQVTDGSGRIRHVITRKRVAVLDGVEYLVASAIDVTASREAQAENRYLAFHDTLTGLPNAALLKVRIEQALAHRRAHGCALIYIALDRFREVKDFHGHPAGDELIAQFALRLSSIVRAADTVARIGDDEFAVLLSDTSRDPKAEEVCRRILISAGRPFDLSGIDVRVGASIGIVLTGGEKIAGDELERRAVVALYEAKNAGKGRFSVFTRSLDDLVTHRHQLQTDLQEALATGDGLNVHYQPIVSISSGEVEGFEALARWLHPTLGMISPGEFIPIAETSGLIVELGEWVLRRACLDAASWDIPLRLSVNVSPVQFVSGELAGMLEIVLAETAFNSALLDLEITEGVLMQDPEQALAVLNRIRELGVKVVLDDFGVGYSSLSYFRQFPFDKVKIDRTFIADMLESQEARAIVQAVISLGIGLNLEVVGEGVENHRQLAALTKMGCTHAQGFLFGRPMPAKHFVRQQGGRSA